MTDLEAICRVLANIRQRTGEHSQAARAKYLHLSAADIEAAERQAIDHVWPLYTEHAKEILDCLSARKRGRTGAPEPAQSATEPEMSEVGELMSSFLGKRHYIAVVLYPDGEIKRITTLCDHHEGDVLRSILEDLDESTPHGDACGSRTVN